MAINFPSSPTNGQTHVVGSVTKSVKTSIITLKAIKALQEAMERIEQLEAKVAALEPAAPQKQADPGSK